MKTASPEFITYLQNTDQFLFADLFSFGLADGTVLAYTDVDLSLLVGTTLYRADQVRIDGLKYHIGVGLDTDEQTIVLTYSTSDTVLGVSWAQALRIGLFDGAYLRRTRAFYSGWNQPPIGTIPLFAGRISTIDQIGRVDAQVKIKSLPLLLDTLMPRNVYQTGCVHSLFDGGCGLAKAAFAMPWSVAGGSSNGTINVPGVNPPVAGTPLAASTEGMNVLLQGQVLFTSGVNDGVVRSIKSIANSPNGFVLSYPLENIPAAGDTFTVWPGCDKTRATCLNRFHNLGNFRGFPYTPDPETGV